MFPHKNDDNAKQLIFFNHLKAQGFWPFDKDGGNQIVRGWNNWDSAAVLLSDFPIKAFLKAQ